MKVYIVLTEFYFWAGDTKAFYTLEKAEEYEKILNELLKDQELAAKILELEVV